MKICVFCSSKAHLVDDLSEEGLAFVSGMVSQGMEMVYGGSREGLMGTLADGVLKQGGRVHGVFPKGLFPTEIEHHGLTQLVMTEDLLERKKVMMEMSDAFVIFPGGLGTLDEALEVLTWKSLGKLEKPVVFYNWRGFWDAFLVCLKDLEARGVLYPEALTSFVLADTVNDIFKGIANA